MQIGYGALMISCFLMGSCVSLKTPVRADRVMLTAPRKLGKFPVTIERVIEDNGKTLMRSTVIWHHFKNNADPDSLELKLATHILLELIDDKQLSAELYQNDSLLKKNVLKGKLKHGYFKRKSSLNFMGVPPIYWSVTSSKMQFGMGPANELLVNNASETNGGLLIMMAGTSGLTHSLTIPSLK